MTASIIAVLGGLVALALGGEVLVRGAVGISRKLGIAPLVTGVVVMGAATSMPEMVASVEAALLGSAAIAWGNIAGSNIANSLLILGASAMIAPIVVRGIGKRDALIGLGAAMLLWLCLVTQVGSPWLGTTLLALLIAYLIWRIDHLPDRGGVDEDEDDDLPEPNIWMALALLGVGLGLLIGGAQYLVSGAIDIARVAGVSEAAIGLTVVAIGTSLPELAATIAAALRGRPELAIGNVVGSNLFNLLLIGGVTMTIAPEPIPAELLNIEWPILVGSSLLVLLLCRFAHTIGRAWGALLLIAFAANTLIVLM